MNFTEETALFDCAGDTLLGILARPESPSDIGVVVIVGGPQYRAGSHRQFVLLSRSLAAAGFSVLRFDYRGMGDSEGEQRDFERVSDDVGAGIGALKAHVPKVKKIILWGLCDGASAALLYCRETQDARVTGLCLLNPWVRSEASLAKTQVKHYYTQRLMQKNFWLKLLSGKVALTALSGFAQRVRVSVSTGREPTPAVIPFQVRMAKGWKSFSGEILLILSGADYTAKEFLEHAEADSDWASFQSRRGLKRHDLAGVDHTFSNATARKLVEDLTLNWLAFPSVQHLIADQASRSP